MTDQQRWDALGCVGGWVETPNIDRLAAEGVRFSNAYTNAPVCIPARVSLVLGRYPHQHGVWKNKRYTVPPNRSTWMRVVRRLGYTTSIFGKTHLHPQLGDLREREHLLHAYGFDHVDEIAGPRASMASRSNLTDRWQEAGVYQAFEDDLRERLSTKPWVSRPSPLPLELYPDVYVARQAAAFIRSYRGAAPWLCCVNFSGPHEPWDAPEPYASRYDPSTMPPPSMLEHDTAERARGRFDRALEQDQVDFEPGDVARLRANYAGKVSLIDDQVGEVLHAVAERGQRDKTVVVFVSDHGEMNGDYGLLYKSNFMNGAVRIPFVISGRRLGARSQGEVVESVVELMDLGATLIDLAGGSTPRRSAARSTIPTIRDPSCPHRRIALSELQRERMVATPDWKMALNPERTPYLLFDLRSDPREAHNLAGRPELRTVEEDLMRELDDALHAIPRRQPSFG